MTVDFGFSLLAGPPKGQIGKWLDDLDVVLPQLQGHFRSLWMTDHFFWEDDPTYEAWTAIGYLAARWPQFEIGPVVLGQSYRNPALTAKMGATLQALTGGRFIMGIGAGWKEDEYHAYGYPYPRPGVRIGQLKDTLEIMKRMWTEPGPVTYHGEHYHVENAWCEPKPDPIPPIMVGGGGDRTIALAVQYADWWNIPDKPFAPYKERADVVRQTCEKMGRDPSTLRLTAFGRLVLGRSEAEVQARGGKWNRTNAIAGTPAQVVEELQRFVDYGADYFMLEILGLPDPDVMGMVLEDVLPKVRG